jgi:hypothetical protein
VGKIVLDFQFSQKLEHEEHEVTADCTKNIQKHDYKFFFVISGVLRVLRVPVLAKLTSGTG